MELRNSLRTRLQENDLTFTWLIHLLQQRGLEYDKTTLSSAFSGTITGPRVEKIMEHTKAILDEYDKFVQSVTT